MTYTLRQGCHHLGEKQGLKKSKSERGFHGDQSTNWEEPFTYFHSILIGSHQKSGYFKHLQSTPYIAIQPPCLPTHESNNKITKLTKLMPCLYTKEKNKK